MSGTTAPHVTIANYVRAESDFQLRGYIEKFDCFGRLAHIRAPYDQGNIQIQKAVPTPPDSEFRIEGQTDPPEFEHLLVAEVGHEILPRGVRRPQPI